MNKLATLAGAVGLLGLMGFVYAWLAGGPPVPAEIKAIQCQQDSKFLAPKGQDVFKIAGTTLVMPCHGYGTGKIMVKHWKMEEEKDPSHIYTSEFKYTTYYFLKRPDGSFLRSVDALNSIPYSGTVRYAVQATISLKDRGLPRADIYDRHWTMSVPTPPAFAATGADTIFWCEDPTLHSDMHHECIAGVRSKSLFWTVHVDFGRPRADDFDMRPEVIEAYRLLAAHILQQE